MRPQKTKILRTLWWLLILLAFSVYPSTEKKLKIKSVRFEGNETFSTDRLHRVMVSRPSIFLNPVYFRQELFEEDLKNLELFYEQQGFLEARITDYRVEKDTSKREVRIFITISEAERTYVESVSILGNTRFPDEVLNKKLDIKTGDPLIRQKIDNTTVEILKLYANNGYLDAEVKPEVRKREQLNLALIDFIITEGPQFTINQIHIRGLENTRPNVIRRELEFKEGEIINYSRLLESQRNLYMTGLFQSVYISPDTTLQGNSSQKDIYIDLKENVPNEFYVAVGYATIERLRGKLEIYTTNFRGTAKKLALLTKASFIDRKLQASFTEPWTFGVPWRTDINLKWEFMDQPGFDFHRIGGQISVGRDFLKRSNITFSYRLERTTLSNIKTLEIPENLRNNVGSVRLSFTYDTRDDLFNTTRGSYLEFGNEAASPFLRSNVNFYRSTLILKYFHPWSSSTVLGSALELGVMDSRTGLRGIPLNERFYAGGPNSVRGFDYQHVGSLDEGGTPVGGRAKLVWNALELRQVVYKMFGGVIFLDMGNVWDAPGDFNFPDLRAAAGVGLRVNTPIGMARLDYGINLNPQGDESPTKLYFSMGQTF